MTLEVRVLAAEFASVMGVSFRNLAGNSRQRRRLDALSRNDDLTYRLPFDPLGGLTSRLATRGNLNGQDGHPPLGGSLAVPPASESLDRVGWRRACGGGPRLRRLGSSAPGRFWSSDRFGRHRPRARDRGRDRGFPPAAGWHTAQDPSGGAPPARALRRCVPRVSSGSASPDPSSSFG